MTLKEVKCFHGPKWKEKSRNYSLTGNAEMSLPLRYHHHMMKFLYRKSQSFCKKDIISLNIVMFTENFAAKLYFLSLPLHSQTTSSQFSCLLYKLL